MVRSFFLGISILFFLTSFFIVKNRMYEFKALKEFPPMSLPSSNPLTYEGIALGRYLFYDTILSLDSNLSCNSCHKQEHAFSDAPVRFSKGHTGIFMKRNTLPLFNLAWHPYFFWDGRVSSIEELILHPVKNPNELALNWNEVSERLNNSSFYKKKFKRVFHTNDIDSTHVTKAIGQFLRTLISDQSKYDKVTRGETSFTEDELDGFKLVNNQTKGDCLQCHTTDADILGTTFEFVDNGLDSIVNISEYQDFGRGGVTKNVNDYGKFKTPSFRNLLFTSPYMHDGRFRTLEEVVDFYSGNVNTSINVDSKMEFVHKKGANLTTEEKRKIVAFLKTMSDSSFVTNPEFKNPFE